MSDERSIPDDDRGRARQNAPALTPFATIRAALTWATEQLRASVSESPRLDADVLLGYLLCWDRARLLVEIGVPLDEAHSAAFRQLIARRAAGEPIAYIVGEREFLNLPLRVGPGVLVPRPETEDLVEWLAARAGDEPRWRGSPVVVDVGTGSGAIALGLASLLPAARVVGVELSPVALRYASENRARTGLAGRVALVRGDLLAPIAVADVIAANLPYLRTDQHHAGIAQEPSEALYAGRDGLDLYRRLLPQAATVLRSPGILAMEIDPEQAGAMDALARAFFPRATVTIHRDLSGRDRFVSVRQGQADSPRE